PLAQSLAWPSLLIVGHELAEHVLQVATTHDQQVVQALAPCRPHPSLANEFAYVIRKGSQITSTPVVKPKLGRGGAAVVRASSGRARRQGPAKHRSAPRVLLPTRSSRTEPGPPQRRAAAAAYRGHSHCSLRRDSQSAGRWFEASRAPVGAGWTA